jgi:glycosyltransferase involved in cell wall biosynthesis
MTTAPYAFTVFIPTYNRAALLLRALKSIEEQSCRDLEVIVVDDGSTDDTARVVRDWERQTRLPVRYHYQENQGKPAAQNAAVEMARGRFVVVLDSDDVLAPNALDIFRSHWNRIPEGDRQRFAGVEGLCAHLSDGRIAGQRYPEDRMESTYPEMFYRYRVHGDKKSATRTDVLREFPFPRFPGEKHMRESVQWNRISREYSYLYVNQVVQYVEYQLDGLSSDNFRRRMQSPRSFRLAHMELLNEYGRHCSPWEQLLDAAKYVRFSLHCRMGYLPQRREISRKGLWLLAVPKGTFDWIRDRIRMAAGKSL